MTLIVCVVCFCLLNQDKTVELSFLFCAFIHPSSCCYSFPLSFSLEGWEPNTNPISCCSCSGIMFCIPISLSLPKAPGIKWRVMSVMVCVCVCVCAYVSVWSCSQPLLLVLIVRRLPVCKTDLQPKGLPDLSIAVSLWHLRALVCLHKTIPVHAHMCVCAWWWIISLQAPNIWNY